jgi:hypothetical protein
MGATGPADVVHHGARRSHLFEREHLVLDERQKRAAIVYAVRFADGIRKGDAHARFRRGDELVAGPGA